MRLPAASRLAPAIACVLAGVLVLLTAALVAAPGKATPEEAREDKLVAAGQLRLAGRRMSCGRTPTLMSATFWDYGGATKNLIILNPVKLAPLPEAVRLYVFAHECGHQIYGPTETRADCYAVERGLREGWLDRAGMAAICEFLKDRPGDHVHPPGPERCRRMNICFDKAKPQRASR